MQKFTEEVVEALPVDGRDRITFEGGGFGVRVTRVGRKIFIAQAWRGGRQHRVSVGTFPDKTVKQARIDALAAVAAVKNGEDPRAARAEREKAIEAGETTVSAFAERWLAEHVRPKHKPRTVADYERLVAQRIGPALGHLIVGRVTKEDVLRLHAEMRSTPRRANYTVATFRALMTYAEDCGLRPVHSNPARRIKMYRERKRERFLSEDEIGKAAEAIAIAERSKKIGPHAAAGLRLALFTGARQGELLAAEWSHFSDNRRVLRLPDSKTNEPRTIHLSDAALEVLRTLPRVGKFIVAGAKDGEPFKNLSRAWIVTRRLPDPETKEARFPSLADVRLHDLRHSFASLAAGRGVSLQMIGMLLGHRVPATTARYAHLARDAVAAVNDELGAAMAAAIEKNAPVPTNVVPSAMVTKMRRHRAAR